MTQRKVGSRLRVARSGVGKVENFDLRLDLLQFVRLCRLYGLEASRLLEEMEEGPSEEDGSSTSFFLAIGPPTDGADHARSSLWTGWPVPPSGLPLALRFLRGYRPCQAHAAPTSAGSTVLTVCEPLAGEQYGGARC